jgi:four helix bundle protein
MSGVSGEGRQPDARGYKKLLAFQCAHQLVKIVYSLTADFPKTEQFGLTSQMRRAAVSVAANIVEGYTRGTTALYLRHVDISFGSCKELEYYLELSGELGYISDADARAALELAGRTAYMLSGLIRGLRSKIDKSAPRPRQDSLHSLHSLRPLHSETEEA